MPIRIQRKRTKGWKMPEGAVYVGRPTKWGNPFFAGHDGIRDRAHAVLAYRDYAYILTNDLGELRGKDLVCWCGPGPGLAGRGFAVRAVATFALLQAPTSRL